ncbi:MAG TPA: hypothetical protein VF473_05765 [Cyclobacteriaceae bacterium]
MVDKIRNTMRQPINSTDTDLLADAKILDSLGNAISQSLEIELKTITKNTSI